MKILIVKPKSLRGMSPSVSGIALIELLGALIIAGIVLVVASAGLDVVRNASRKADVRNTRRQELSRAIAYISNDVKEGKSVAKLSSTSCPTKTKKDDGAEIDVPGALSEDCLVITKTDGTGNFNIYYRFADISNLDSASEFKPGILYRQEKEGTGITAQPLIDGLAIENENDADLTPTCPSGFDGPFGNRGFQFCLEDNTNPDNKTVQIYLYGYTGAGQGDAPIEMTVQGFARSN
jgi:hypothetical protein